MRLCRFNGDRIGVVRGDQVHDVTVALEKMPPLRYPLPFGDALIAHLDLLRPEMERQADRTPGRDVASLRLNSPVANPSKIVATPSNYKAHADEARADPEIAVYQGSGRGRSGNRDCS